ncbi:hypothetical protein ACHQM5_022571 [Ranunculus cassubicifolius]
MSSKPLVFTLTLILLLVLASKSYSQPPSAQSVEYHILALQWEPTTSEDNVKREDFRIHGLWPSSSREVVQYCPGPDFNGDMLKDTQLLNDLLKWWPSLVHSVTSRNFWAEQWRKHGTCSGMDQVEFFQKTLQLRDEAKALKKLQAILIFPDNKKTYLATKIISAYDENFPRITCKGNKLAEIHLNLTLETFELQAIATGNNKDCPKDVLLPKGNRS